MYVDQTKNNKRTFKTLNVCKILYVYKSNPVTFAVNTGPRYLQHI